MLEEMWRFVLSWRVNLPFKLLVVLPLDRACWDFLPAVLHHEDLCFGEIPLHSCNSSTPHSQTSSISQDTLHSVGMKWFYSSAKNTIQGIPYFGYCGCKQCPAVQANPNFCYVNIRKERFRQHLISYQDCIWNLSKFLSHICEDRISV